MTTAHKPDALVLDFFSGSGTTAHAVMRLNKQDGGRRRSISVTNNEVSPDEQRMLRAQDLRPGDSEWEALGICEYVTKPRITSAITARTPGVDLALVGEQECFEGVVVLGVDDGVERLAAVVALGPAATDHAPGGDQAGVDRVTKLSRRDEPVGGCFAGVAVAVA